MRGLGYNWPYKQSSSQYRRFSACYFCACQLRSRVIRSAEAERMTGELQVFTSGTAVVVCSVGSMTYRGRRRQYQEAGQPGANGTDSLQSKGCDGLGLAMS